MKTTEEKALDALNEMFEAFVVDNGEMVPHQAKAARKAQRLLRPVWKAHRAKLAAK